MFHYDIMYLEIEGITKKQSKRGLSMKMSINLYRAINSVYQSIGYDIPEDCDNEEAIECCIDADRLKTYDFPTEHNELMALISEFGYTPVLKYISKNVSLV